MSLELLQERIKKDGFDALYINRNNMFIGQDILDEENNILKLTGFSGSYAELIVTSDNAYLFTDGRYELQAKQEVDLTKIEIFIKSTDLYDFFKKYKREEKKEIKIAYNPWTISIERLEHLENITQYCQEESPLMFIESDIITSIKPIKKANVFELDIKFSGKSREEKIKDLLENMKIAQVDAYFITAADSVSWLLNLRSDYLPNSPVIRAYALVDKDKNTTVFSDDFAEYNGTKVLPLSDIEKEIKKHQEMKINLDKNSPVALRLIANRYNIETYNFFDPCYRQKAIKNDIETKCVKNAHIKDGVAVTKLLYWLDNNWEGKSELDIVKKLYNLRTQQELFFSNSFDTIAGYGENGAIIHYHPTEKTNKHIEEGSLLLLDSGGQYFDGTTDVTRTIPIGSVSEEIKHNYTLVLKAHIALANTFFPDKTNGSALDALARKDLWKEGKTYNHGTGHGVGFFLNVHEGPQSISQREGYFSLLENMIISIEPGFYKENHYGIRIENLYLIKKVIQKDIPSDMLCFKPLTIVPIDTRPICYKMLTDQELNWLQNYNNSVYSALSLFLNNEENIWLKTICNIKSE